MVAENNEYRESLARGFHANQRSYDRTILTLASGGLAVSITFYKNFIGDEQALCLVYLNWAWICWVISLISLLVGYILGQLANLKAIKQYDKNYTGQSWGGGYNYVATGLNWFAGISLITGIILMMWFVSSNIRGG